MHILQSQGVAGAAISSAGPNVPKGSNSLGREGPESLRVSDACQPLARRMHGGRRPKSLEGGDRGGVGTDAGVDLWGIWCRCLI